MKFNRIFVAAAVAVIAAGCVKEQVGDIDLPVEEEVVVVADAPKLIAELDEPETRTCIDADANATGKLSMLWTPSDEVGVFTSGGSKNVKYVNDEKSVNVPNASFSATSSVNGNIQYVYYPYSSANNGKEATALSGTVPAEQVMGQSIAGDYKYGTLKSVTEDGGYKFKFNNMFSLVRFNVDASGTEIAGEKLESVTLTVTRNGAEVPVTGSFTFSAVDGSYTLGSTSNVLTTTWNQEFKGTLSSLASVFPEVKAGDKLNFLIKTENYKATVTVTSKVDFEKGKYYTFPLTFKKLSGMRIVGDFTAATYNVDGLPDIDYLFDSINPDGPGAGGTATISSRIAAQGWDIIGFSEDFEHHTQLISSLGAYRFGTHRGTVTSSQLTSRADTDGLEFATLKASCDFGDSEYFDQFDKEYGGVTGGANTCIKKGFRHYVVTFKDNTQVDVIITHMNTYSGGNFITPAKNWLNAQHAQLTEIANYINTITTANKRPVVFMGDTNCRYTRHDFKTNFWSKFNSGLVVQDPWADFQWGGVYPEYGSKSLMVSDATGTDSSTDIICKDTQQGEVVDKIIYVNNANFDTAITAISYLRDYDNFNGLADHMPIVADFSYSRKVKLTEN